MNKIIYNKFTGEIIEVIGVDQDISIYYKLYTEDFKKKIDELIVGNYPRDLDNYRIINNKLMRFSDDEIKEKRIYGKILTEEERQLEKLKPSLKEIRKAEQTIEILTLIQEVM